MKHLIVFLAVVSSVIAGDIKLPSSRVLKNAQVGPLVYTTGIPSSLCLKYETSVDIASKKEVSDEVSDIWKTFRFEAEKGKYVGAVIAVVGPSSGSPPLVKTAEQRNFIFEKKNGAWKMALPSVWQDNKEPNQALEPTPIAVTPRADARSRPAAVVANRDVGGTR